MAELGYDYRPLYGALCKPRPAELWWLPNGLHGIIWAASVLAVLAYLWGRLGRWYWKCAAVLVGIPLFLALDFIAVIAVACWHGDCL